MHIAIGEDFRKMYILVYENLNLNLLLIVFKN